MIRARRALVLPFVAGGLLLLGACAASTPPAVHPPGQPDHGAGPAAASASKAPDSAASTPPPFDDPLAVRCGVDDSPVDVLGSVLRTRGGTVESAIDRSFLGVRARPSGPRDFSQFQPVLPSANNVALDPGTTLFAIEETSRDGRALGPGELPKGFRGADANGATEESVGCGLTATNDGAPLSLEVRLAASGLPYAALARGCFVERSAEQCLAALARSFIYTTALPPHSIATIAAAYDLLVSTNAISKLKENIECFNDLVKGKDGFIESKSAIHCRVYGDNNKVNEIENKFEAAGLFVKGIKSPTVKAGSERIRICLHAFNTKEEIKRLIDLL